MKRLCLCLVVCVSLLTSLSAGIRAQYAYGYIYGDVYRESECTLDAAGTVGYIYIWIHPNSDFKCAEYSIQTSGGPLLWFATEFNPDLLEPIWSGSDGTAACFAACQTDWAWISKTGFFVQTGDETLIEIGPFTGSPYPKIMDCDYVEWEMWPYFPYVVNGYARMCEFYWCYCDPTEIYDIVVEDNTRFDVIFHCPTDQSSMVSIDNYSLFEKDDPENAIPIGGITYEGWYNDIYGIFYYRFTVDAPLEPFTTYTLHVNYIDGACRSSMPC